MTRMTTAHQGWLRPVISGRGERGVTDVIRHSSALILVPHALPLASRPPHLSERSQCGIKASRPQGRDVPKCRRRPLDHHLPQPACPP
jgi:hypothetical protein